ncbi:hypothetical protein AC579_1651 [Pseudocercospora musae]|uniref:Uncharacterized protein n=1 Tax=Pseudocercospora musae TaxID=113226 RepID=A0A139IAK0_9PEZI|nr:hypothetical protein AC579_1651 [Pseudocercospora musae]
MPATMAAPLEFLDLVGADNLDLLGNYEPGIGHMICISSLPLQLQSSEACKSDINCLSSDWTKNTIPSSTRSALSATCPGQRHSFASKIKGKSRIPPQCILPQPNSIHKTSIVPNKTGVRHDLRRRRSPQKDRSYYHSTPQKSSLPKPNSQDEESIDLVF